MGWSRSDGFPMSNAANVPGSGKSAVHAYSVTKGIQFFAPGKTHRLFFGSAIERLSGETIPRFDVEVTSVLVARSVAAGLSHSLRLPSAVFRAAKCESRLKAR